MDYLLLTLTAFTTSVQNILKQRYNKKARGGVFIFSALSSAVAALVFIVTSKDSGFSASQLPYSFGFAASYCSAIVFSILSIRTGPLAKTNLVLSCSLLIPTFYGIIALREDIKPTLIAGIILLVAAIFLTNYVKSTDESEKRASLKWIIYVILAFIANGMCSTVQKMENNVFGAYGKNTFMIIALASVVAVMLISSFAVKDERENLKDNLKAGAPLIALCGLCNGVTNALVMFLNTKIPASVMFPVISAFGMILIFVYSVTVLKEKYSTLQKIGYACGLVSVILLNL